MRCQPNLPRPGLRDLPYDVADHRDLDAQVNAGGVPMGESAGSAVGPAAAERADDSDVMASLDVAPDRCLVPCRNRTGRQRWS